MAACCLEENCSDNRPAFNQQKTTMTRFWYFLGALCVLCGSISTSRGDVSCAPPGGYVKVQIDGNSENVISAPMRKRGAFTGEIAACGTNSLSFSAPGWTRNQYAQSGTSKPRYYLEVVSGDLAGLCFPIQTNTAEELVLDTGGCALSGTFPGLGAIKALTYATTTGTDGAVIQTVDHPGDIARIRPAWTIGELFTTGTNGSNGVLNAFDSMEAANPANGGGDRIDLPANEVPGMLKKPGKSLCYIANVGWRNTGDVQTDESDNALLPGAAVIVHRNAKDQSELVLVGYPKVDRAVLRVPSTEAGQPNLLYLGLPFSESLSLDESGLALSSGSNGTVGAVGTSLSLSQREDEMFLFEGSHGGPAPIPTRRFVSLQGVGWQELGNGNSMTTGTAQLLLPGSGFGILKKPNQASTYWISQPPFVQ